MRTTNNMLINNMMYYMNNNLDRMNKYQTQMATGKKISAASDDPIIAARALKFRTDVSEVQQFKRNAQDAQSWLDTTESALTKMKDILQVLRERAVQASNDTMTGDDRNKIKMEVEQLKHQMIHLANTSYAGRYIFSGHSTDTKLLNEDGSYNVSVSSQETVIMKGNALSLPITIGEGINDEFNINLDGQAAYNNIKVPADSYSDLDSLAAAIKGAAGFPVEVDVNAESGRLQFCLKNPTDASGSSMAIYLKDGTNDALQSLGFQTDVSARVISRSESMNYIVGIGDLLNVNVPGTELFGTGVKGDKGDFMEKMDNFIKVLEEDNSEEIGQAISDIDALMNRTLSIQADIGARSNRVELTVNRLESDDINFTALMSENEDVDMAEVIMNLKNEENVYRSSLAGGARIIMPTLLDFLR